MKVNPVISKDIKLPKFKRQIVKKLTDPQVNTIVKLKVIEPTDTFPKYN